MGWEESSDGRIELDQMIDQNSETVVVDVLGQGWIVSVRNQQCSIVIVVLEVRECLRYASFQMMKVQRIGSVAMSDAIVAKTGVIADSRTDWVESFDYRDVNLVIMVDVVVIAVAVEVAEVVAERSIMTKVVVEVVSVG